MTKLFILFLISSLMFSAFAQTVDMKTDNFRQTDETTITWELWIRKASGNDFGLHSFQAQWEFNTDILNTGNFTSIMFTIEAGADAVFMDHFDSGDAEIVGDDRFSFVTTNLPSDGNLLTLITDEWKHIATFSAQLIKDGQAHNFADTDPAFVFRIGGAFYVYAAGETYSNAAEYELPTPTLFPSAGDLINDRQLSGFFFSGTGNWEDIDRWNNATNENNNQIPSGDSNAIIGGETTISDSRAVNELTVAEGSYLVISQFGQLSTEKIFNDNQGSGSAKSNKNGTVVIAQWDFEDLTQTSLPYLADGGIVPNEGSAQFNTTATFQAFTDAVAGGSRAAMANTFYATIGFPPVPDPRDWRISLSTLGYENFKLSSVQWSDAGVFGSTGPTEFIIQWSFDGTNWQNIAGGTVTVAEDWTTGLTDNLILPQEVNDQTNVFIRWLNNSGEKQGFSAIDDIIITAEALPEPPTGILVASSATGTGSLIHNNEGVHATMERYFPGEQLQWHLISAPMTGMAIAGSDFEPGSVDPADNFYMWHESGWWLNYKTGPGGNFDTYNPGFDFIPGRGYLVAYDPVKNGQVKRFRGELSTGAVDIGLLFEETEPTPKGGKEWIHQPGWNLIGNPYSSGIDWGQVLGNNTGVLEDHFAYVYDRQSNENGVTEGYTQVDGSLSNQIIAGNQGFMVKVAGSGGKNTFLFPPASRVHGGAFFKDESGHPDRITLRMYNDLYFDETTINLRPESHFVRDRYDALKLFSYNAAIPQLYSLSEDDIRLSVNAIPFIDKDHRIPMGAMFPVDDEYTLRLVDATGQFSSGEIYLYDMLTGEEVLLSKNDPYIFVAESSQNNYGSTRFKIGFSPDDDATNTEDATDTDKIRAWFHDNTLHVLTTQNNTRIEVIDINGRTQKVFRQDKGKQSYLLSLHYGVYIVRITGPESTVVLRIVQR